MHLRFTKRTKAEVSIFDLIGVDKEGNEITYATNQQMLGIIKHEKGGLRLAPYKGSGNKISTGISGSPRERITL